MSTATAEKPKAKSKTTDQHSDAIKALLKKAGRTERAELTEEQVNTLGALEPDASVSAIETALGAKKATARKVSVKYPEPVREAYKRALELTGTPEKGGPKYPLTVKQADAIKKAMAAKGKAVSEANAGLEAVSDGALLKIAKGKDAPAEAVKAVRAFLKAHVPLREDRTMYARKGAAIVLAYREAA